MEWLIKVIADAPILLRVGAWFIGCAFWTWLILIQPCQIYGKQEQPENKNISERKNESMSSEKKAKTIIGKRIRIVVGKDIPEDDNENTVIGEDTKLVVDPDEAKNKTIIGQKIEMKIGNQDAENSQ